MPDTLPYLTSAGSLKTALDRIRAAATPERVNGDFIANTLNMKGGTGAAITPYLKKIGFVGSDGTPTDLYKRFRNRETAGKLAAGEAVLYGYKELQQVNEKFYNLNETGLKALILQVTGLAEDSRVPKLIYSTLTSLMSYAEFEGPEPVSETQDLQINVVEQIPQFNKQAQVSSEQQVDLRLAYTINLNLPATSDQSVFNAIFRSLKEHLLSNNE